MERIDTINYGVAWLMKYSYEYIINNLNEGIIESVVFSVKNYSHYKKCKISRIIDINGNNKQFIRIEVKLVEDNTETISFCEKFKNDYKLFKLGRKGSFSLNQIWENIEILQINYNNK